MSPAALPGLAAPRTIGAVTAAPAGMPVALKLVPSDTTEAPTASVSDDAVRRRIVLSALRLADAAGGWDPVHMHAVAPEAGVTMEELHRHFPDKDCITEGLFDLADAALTAAARVESWPRLALRVRLFITMTAWLDTLAPHRRIIGEMLGYKMHPEHVHLQVRGVARISRTVQWWREVARSPSTGWRRELEEAALTTIYLTTFARWMRDNSPGAAHTKRQLRSALALAERTGGLLGYAA